MSYKIQYKFSGPILSLFIIFFLLITPMFWFDLYSPMIPALLGIGLLICIQFFMTDVIHIDGDKITLERKCFNISIRKKRTYTPKDFRRFEFNANFFDQVVAIKFKRYNTLVISQAKKTDREALMAIFEYCMQNHIECRQTEHHKIAYKSAKLQIESDEYEKRRMK